MSTTAKFVVAILVVLAVAQFAPKAVNAFLGLLLIGIILMRYSTFSSFVSQLGTLGK